MYRNALLKQKHLARTNLLQQTNSKITNVTNLLCWEVYQEGFLYQNSCSYRYRPLDFDPDSLLNLQCCFFYYFLWFHRKVSFGRLREWFVLTLASKWAGILEGKVIRRTVVCPSSHGCPSWSVLRFNRWFQMRSYRSDTICCVLNHNLGK